MIKEAARILAGRMSVRIGLVTDHKLIRKYKALKGTSWFPDEVQLSTIVVQRYDKASFGFDFLNLHSENDLVYFIQKKSLQPVQEIFPESFKLIENVGQVIVVAMVDFNSPNPEIVKKSKHLVEDVLPQVAKSLFMGMVVAYNDIQVNPHIAKNMNLLGKDLPLLFHFDPAEGPIKYTGKLNVDDISVWGKEIVLGSSVPPPLRESNI